MAITAYTPSQLTSYPTSTNLMNLYSVADGIRTGFAFYASGNAIFASTTAFFNKLIAEGFFTGSYPLKYYSPAVATVLAAAGIEARMRAEGISTGNLSSGTIVHAAGDTQAVILANQQAEGYVTGAGQFIGTADAALSDTQCTDGRQMGSGCVAPTMYSLTVALPGTGASASAQQTINLPYACNVMIWLTFEKTNLFGGSASIPYFDAIVGTGAGSPPTEIPGLRLHDDAVTGANHIQSVSAILSIPANTSTIIKLYAATTAINGNTGNFYANMIVFHA